METGACKMPQVMAEIEQLGRETETLFKTIGSLEERLAKVLRPNTPTPPMDGNLKEGISRVALAIQLQEQVGKIRGMIEYVRGVEQRLEI